MATIATSPKNQAAPPSQVGQPTQPVASSQAQVRVNPRVERLRSWMLAVIAAAVSFGVLAGLVAWQANLATYNNYHKIVDVGSVSVDSALQARAAVLDHMSAAATFLETTGVNQSLAKTRATERWQAFNDQARISWRNLSDTTFGEYAVYAAADASASDYIQQIGAMFSYYAAGETDKAGAAFLSARETLNTRLVPALGGLEEVKVESMETTYAGASQVITNWQYALIAAGVLLVLVLLAGLLAIRLMHYRWSWPVGAALVVSIVLTALMAVQLGQARADAQVMVRQAYDNVAGVQDMEALLSQGRALESIAIFDPTQSASHLASFDQYTSLVEQRLCGPADCSKSTFLQSPSEISTAVHDVAVDEKNRLGLPQLPLVANVSFSGQAAAYEKFRTDYQTWLTAHDKLSQEVQAGQLTQASQTSTGDSAQAFSVAVASADAAGNIARSEYEKIWKGVYTTTGINQILWLLFPIMGVVAAIGVWQRRSQLFA